MTRRSHGKRLGLILALSLLASNAFGITPDNVIQMHKSGLPAEVIVQTLQSTGSTFNLSVSDVKKLREAGVPANVIDVMVSSGMPAPEPPPEPAPEPSPLDATGADMSGLTEAQKAEAEKIRAAAQAAAEAERARIAAAERARVQEELKVAQEALDEKDYARAAQLYSAFLNRNYADQEANQKAQLGLAQSEYGLKFYGNAAEAFHELLKAGSDSPVFVPAFEGLRQCTKKIAYHPATLESLTGNYIDSLPAEVKNSYNYFLGKFFFEYNRNTEARLYLQAVQPGAEDYAEAQYILGLIEVQEAGDLPSDDDTSGFASFGRILVGATQYFQEAVNAAEASDNLKVQSLAYLALARVAYSLGSFDAAIFYYRKVPTESTSYVDALHESGWSYFLKGDVRRGMGIFHTLDGPDWHHYFLPDMYLLEATVFMTTCHFEYAHDAIKRIEERYLSLAGPLNAFLAEYNTPEDLYNAVVLKKTRKNIELPKPLRMAMISNSDFYDLYTTVTTYRREIESIQSKRDALGHDLTEQLLGHVENAHREHVMALGIKIAEILQNLSDELVQLEVQVTEIRIEIDEAQTDYLQKETEDLYKKGEKQQQTSEVAAQERATVFVGDKYVTWPFEGEYWGDEINNYRSDLKDVCK